MSEPEDHELPKLITDQNDGNLVHDSDDDKFLYDQSDPPVAPAPDDTDKLLRDLEDEALLQDANDGLHLYDQNDPPGGTTPLPPPPPLPTAPDAKLLYDQNDGQLVHDRDDGLYLHDANDPPTLPSIPGLIDAVGGPIGGPIGERVYLIDSPVLATAPGAGAGGGAVDAEWLSIGNHPIMGGMFKAAQLAALDPIDLRLASIDFVSRADDPDEPSRFWDGRVIDPGSISLTMPLVPVGEAAIESSFGQIVIDNSDGAYDTILDDNLAISQPIEVKLGTVRSFVGAFVTVIVSRITSIGMTQETLTLDLRDSATYAQNLYPTQVYSGAGGSEGDAGLVGTIKPVVLGRVWNASPVLINSVQLAYQLHDGPIAAVSGVFDGGVALEATSDYPSYDALMGASIPPGKYATSLAAGVLRVGSTPVFAITAHLDGHAPAGVTIRSIATWLAGRLESVVGLNVDLEAFADLPEHPAGWIWQEPFAFSTALSRFVGDAGWHWGSDVTGLITTRRLDPPSVAEVARTYDPADIMSIERSPMPDGYDGVHRSRLVRYGRNWTVQTGNIAATALEAGRRQGEWKTTGGSRLTGSRNAIDPPVLDTTLAEESAAGALANHLLDLHGVHRRMFTIETKIHGSLPWIGSTVRVVYPRFGLAAGALFRIVDINLRLAEGMAQMLLWGGMTSGDGSAANDVTRLIGENSDPLIGDNGDNLIGA